MPFLAPIGAAILAAAGVAGPVTAGTAALAGTLAVAGTAASVASAGMGIYSATQAGKDKGVASALTQGQANLEAPKATDTLAMAREQVARKRKRTLLSGGQTIFANTTPSPITPSNLGQKTLLGE